MSKFNKVKVVDSFSTGVIAGTNTVAAGKYSDYELLRRVTLSNLMFESNYYQSADTIMLQIEALVKVVDPELVVSLSVECRFEQKLRHTPLWLLILVNEYHKGYPVADAFAKVANRPDMLMDTLGMIMTRKGLTSSSGKHLHILNGYKGIKKGMSKAFDNYNNYQIAKYRKNKMEITLIDVVNLVHPTPTSKNETALKELVLDTLKPANTWESALSAGGDKKETFTKMVTEDSLGSLAILRNLRNMKDCGMPRQLIKKAISQVNSSFLTPLNFLAAQRNAVEYTGDINDAMKRCFADYKIPGTTILAIDVSGSMGGLTSENSNFSRMDLAFAMAALGSYVFEDMILVFTAGSDCEKTEKHMIYSNADGFGIFNHYSKISSDLGGGGIFTAQLCEKLKAEGYAKDATRLVVISDSQDIDVANGKKVKPDVSPYKYSYIIDISSHTHGIKTSNWTAEINGWSDSLFRYIVALEKVKTNSDNKDMGND